MREVVVGSVTVGEGRPLALIAGPCVIESPAHTLDLARRLKAIAERRGVPLIFKASFDKANRTSLASFRGPGLETGLEVLGQVRRDVQVPVLTDIHEPHQAERVAEVADVLQIPAFLCRQTDLLLAAARTGRAVNVKKGQFLAPQDVRHVIEKLTAAGLDRVLVTERGTSFGYHNLVVDMRSFPILRSFGFPVIFDVTHSVQLPGGADGASGGEAQFIRTLAAAGVAAGVDGVFLEVHQAPEQARSDGANALRLDDLDDLLAHLTALDALARPVS